MLLILFLFSTPKAAESSVLELRNQVLAMVSM
jgi:hypothetical protein